MASVIKKYTPAFKEKVVSEIAAKKFQSFGQAAAYYNITGSNTITRWVRQIKPELIPKVVLVDVQDGSR